MIFFADENVPTEAAHMLEIFDHDNTIRAYEDCFERGLPDTEWIRAVAKWKPGTAILCGDGRILRNKPEQAVLRAANLTFVHLAPGWLHTQWAEYAWKIVKAWPAIVHSVLTGRRATVFKVNVGGLKIERVRYVSELGRK